MDPHKLYSRKEEICSFEMNGTLFMRIRYELRPQEQFKVHFKIKRIRVNNELWRHDIILQNEVSSRNVVSTDTSGLWLPVYYAHVSELTLKLWTASS